MLFVEVYGLGPGNTQPVMNCVRQLPFYRSTGQLPAVRVPEGELLSGQPSPAPS